MNFLAPVSTIEPVRVMLCDDSAVQRGIMARILETDPGIRIVHRAANGQAALSVLAVTKPQVVLKVVIVKMIPSPTLNRAFD